MTPHITYKCARYMQDAHASFTHIDLHAGFWTITPEPIYEFCSPAARGIVPALYVRLVSQIQEQFMAIRFGTSGWLYGTWLAPSNGLTVVWKGEGGILPRHFTVDEQANFERVAYSRLTERLRLLLDGYAIDTIEHGGRHPIQEPAGILLLARLRAFVHDEDPTWLTQNLNTPTR